MNKEDLLPIDSKKLVAVIALNKIQYNDLVLSICDEVNKDVRKMFLFIDTWKAFSGRRFEKVVIYGHAYGRRDYNQILYEVDKLELQTVKYN